MCVCRWTFFTLNICIIISRYQLLLQLIFKQKSIQKLLAQSLFILWELLYLPKLLKQKNVFRYEYNLTDHLGNVRISFADVDEDGSIDETMEVLTSQSFYPFGLRLGGLSTTTGVPNRYRYNGKELQDELGLGWYDYGARMYDPSVARWNGVDELASQYDAWSPYNYVLGNPLRFIDPNGQFVSPPLDYYDQKGNRLGSDGNDDGRLVVVTNKKEAKRIKKVNKKGGTTQESSVSSGVELPNAFVRGKISKSVDRSNAPTADDPEGGFHEEGGIIGKSFEDGSDMVVNSKSGAFSDPSVSDRAEVNVFDSVDPSERAKLDLPYSGTFHVHPSGERVSGSGTEAGNVIGSTKTSNFVQTPSDRDTSNSADRTQRGLVTGNSYVLGARDKTVYIYNGNGVIATFPLKQFRQIGNE